MTAASGGVVRVDSGETGDQRSPWHSRIERKSHRGDGTIRNSARRSPIRVAVEYLDEREHDVVAIELCFVGAAFGLPQSVGVVHAWECSRRYLSRFANSTIVFAPFHFAMVHAMPLPPASATRSGETNRSWIVAIFPPCQISARRAVWVKVAICSSGFDGASIFAQSMVNRRESASVAAVEVAVFKSIATSIPHRAMPMMQTKTRCPLKMVIHFQV